MKLLLSLLAAATLSLAADATGTWTGEFTLKTGDQAGQKRPAHLTLKQEGTKLTGTGGPNAENQHPITNGKAEDGVITFEVGEGERIMRFNLKQEGDGIKGRLTRGEDSADMELKREKS